MQSLTRSQFFLDYNFQYINVSNFVVWYKTDFATLTKEEITSLKAKIMKLPTLAMDIFDKTLENIDEDYPFSLSPKLILALLIATGVCFIIFTILFIWYKRKTTLATSTVEHLHKLILSLKEQQAILEFFVAHHYRNLYTLLKQKLPILKLLTCCLFPTITYLR